MMMRAVTLFVVSVLLAAWAPVAGAQAALSRDDLRLVALKADAARQVDALARLTQQMVDSVFSFAELGFQEIESSRYLTAVLEQRGFRVTRGVAGIPTAWIAEWGSGRPVISLGSDIDGIPQASQKPGVAYRAPILDGAPGHGEGHNSGVPLNVTAALAVKTLMEREKLPGTIRLWPGVAEELLASKAWYVREGVFKDVDDVAMRLGLLEAQLAEAEDGVHHLLGVLLHGLDIGHRVRLQLLDAGVILREVQRRGWRLVSSTAVGHVRGGGSGEQGELGKQ